MSVDDESRVHVLFASEPEIEQEIRHRIEKLLEWLTTETVIHLLGSCHRAVQELSLRMKPHTAAA